MPKKELVDRAQQFLSDNDYLKEVLGLIPAERKDVILEQLGLGVVRQSDYSRSMDEAAASKAENEAYKARLDDWYQANLDAINNGSTALERLEAAEAETARLKAAGATASPVASPAGLSEDKIKEAIAAAQVEIETRGLNTMAYMTNAATVHFKNFGEPLDTYSLIAYAQKNRLPFDQAYQQMFAKKYEDAGKVAQERREADLKKSIREEVIKEMGPNRAYLQNPLNDQSPTLAGLKIKPAAGAAPTQDAPPEFGVKAALDEFYRLQST